MQANTVAKILQSAESATVGSHAWPKDKSQDKYIGMRINWGEICEKDGKWMQNICLQLNADANNVAVKKKANQSTHQNLGVVAIDIDSPPTKDEVLEMIRTSVDNVD